MRIEAINNRLMESSVPEWEITALRNYKRGLMDGLFEFVMGCNPDMTYNEVKTHWDNFEAETGLIRMTQGISLE
jgi:hypothetical protein